MRQKKSSTVLIVGDKSQLRAMVAEQNSFKGFKSIVASCCEEALEVASTQSKIDLLVTDILLGIRYEKSEIVGADFVSHFMKLYPKTSILFMIP